ATVPYEVYSLWWTSLDVPPKPQVSSRFRPISNTIAINSLRTLLSIIAEVTSPLSVEGLHPIRDKEWRPTRSGGGSTTQVPVRVKTCHIYNLYNGLTPLPRHSALALRGQQAGSSAGLVLWSGVNPY